MKLSVYRKNMKKHVTKLNIWQRTTINILIVAAFIAGGFILIYNATPTEAAGSNLGGYAWSSNIGWISFSCDDELVCPTSDYGVNIDLATGLFSGYAWSSNIGWISFNWADTGAPPNDDQCPGGPCTSQLNFPTEVLGWMRVLANGGGWDGWIKLGEPAPKEWTPQVTRNTGSDPDELEGYAWGGDVVGWVSLNCATDVVGTCASSPYAVVFKNTSPIVDSLTVNFSSTAGPVCTSSERFQWNFTDAEDLAVQTGYRLQVSADAVFTSPIQFDSGQVTSGSEDVFIAISTSPIGEFDDGDADGDGQLAFSTTYFWRVEVFDSEGAGSGYVNGSSFITSLHPYPTPNFSWDPAEPSEDEDTQMTDETVFDAASAPQSWNWTFPVGTSPLSSTLQDPIVVFGSTGSQNVTLLVTDGALAADGNSGTGQCSITQNINVLLPLPEFIEIPPVTFWDNTLQYFFAFIERIKTMRIFAVL